MFCANQKMRLVLGGLAALAIHMGGDGTVEAYQAEEGSLTSPKVESDLALTIYNDNRALIRDKRKISYKRGRSVIVLPGVSSEIQSQTVTFEADGVSIIEQNFDYDLLTPSKLMEKAVGKTVRLIRTNPATGKEASVTAEVLSVNNGVVVKIGDRIEVLRDDNLPTRVIFDKVPDNLRASPTLSVAVNANNTGRKDTSLTYLSSGLGWSADYVALFNEERGKMDFQGWVTLRNNTQTTFRDAKVQMVAGAIAQANSSQRRPVVRSRSSSSSVRAGGNENTGEARIGDNYLYPLPGRTTVASQQTKQVGFVDADDADAAKIYEYRSFGFRTLADPQNVDVRIAFSNSKKSGLGAALPNGIVRVYTKDSEGRAQFIGEDNIDHVAGGAELAIKIGEAFDVTVQPTLVSQKVINRKTTQYVMEYTVRNAKTEPVKVTVRERVWGQSKIINESKENRNPSHNLYFWDVDVPAEGEAKLRFTMQIRT